MVKGFYKDLIICIFFVLLLLGVCVSMDYADTNITITSNKTVASQVKVNNTDGVLLVNESNSSFIAKSSDKIHRIAPKYPVISMWAKPSCGCRYSYTWHKYTFINYCPHCHKYGVLRKNPKGVYEREYTCCIDDCDYCAVCGKEKYSYSHYYLRRA